MYTCREVAPDEVAANLTVSTTIFLAPQPPPSNDPHCVECDGHGELVFLYERPGGPPGNMIVPCPVCRRAS